LHQGVKKKRIKNLNALGSKRWLPRASPELAEVERASYLAANKNQSNAPGAQPSLSWQPDQGNFNHVTKCGPFIRGASPQGVA
jgi:hypothetical protein